MRVWTIFKRTTQNIEWPTLIGLWGFITLAITLRSQGYPLYFVIGLAGIGIVVSFLAAYNSYRQKSTALLDKYEERFFERMKRERRLAAQYLLGKRKETDELEDVLDFFEAPIARKLLSGHLDSFEVYSYFFHLISLYLQAAQGFIEKYRREEPAAWGDLESLWNKMFAIEKAELKRDRHKRKIQWQIDQDLLLRPEKLKEYLEQEAR